MRRSVVLLSLFILTTIIYLAPFVLAADSVSLVKVTDKKAELTGSAGVEKVRYFTLDSPKRLVVDLYGVQPGEHGRSFPLNSGFKALRVGPYQDKTRFVFDVVGDTFPTFNVDTKDEQVVVTWQETQNIARQVQAEPVTVGRTQVTSIDFSATAGESIVLIGLDGPAIATEPVRNGNKVLFSLKSSTLPRALRRTFDTLAFPSALHSVTPYLVNIAGQPEVRFTVTLKADVPYRLEKATNGYSFVVTDGNFSKATPAVSGVLPIAVEGIAGSSEVNAPARSEKPMALPSPVPVIDQVAVDSSKYTGAKTSLVFDNAEVKDILRLIAEISDLNIIAGDDVNGSVTLRLIDVPWDQALELILDITDLGMLQEGNIVRILPKTKIRSMRETELTAARSQEKLEPVVTEVVTVSYADLGSVAGPAKEVLSERGSLTEDSRNKLLIITDVPARIQKAKELISILDTPERQVMIEARIVQVNSSYSRNLGINWGLSSTDVGDNSFLKNGIAGVGGAVGQSFVINPTNTSIGSFIGNAGVGAQMTFGQSIFDNVILDMQISALESGGNGKVISTPRVTTLNGEKATISQGTTIPYQTSGADGPKTEFVSAELKLEVTPVINPDNSIILEILATNDSPSITDGASAPSIDTKKAETKLLIKNGETTVLGGIFVETLSDSESGVPGLMNIPILGHLFKSTTKGVTKDELLIFITPRIITNN